MPALNPPMGTAVSAATPSRMRYWILLMTFIVTTVNYADRATLSVTGPAMREEFGFDAIQMGYIFSAFSWAYVMAQIPGGWLLDRFGARRVYAASIFLWSAFTLLQDTIGVWSSAATAVATLFGLRFMVGLAESPAFPANAKVVASWFPTAERGQASAIFNSAQYFAAMVFTPLMAALTHWIGWHHVYLWMGVLGFALALVWLKLVHSPAKHLGVSKAELAYIEAGGSLIHMGEQSNEASTAQVVALPKGQTGFYLKQLLTNRMLLGVYLGQFSVNVLTYFFLTWFPVYLVQSRHMTILKAGFMVSLPAMCGFIGGVLGGLHFRPHDQVGLFANHSAQGAHRLRHAAVDHHDHLYYVDSEWLVVGFMALAFFGKGVSSLGWAVVADTAPKEVIGLVGSIFNMFGNIAGIVIGYILATTGSFNGALLFVGLNALVTVLSYLVIVKDIQRIELKHI